MGQSEGSREDRKAPKYYGLFNQGATCYLNSVLQVLFMTKDFRKAVERFTDENPDSIDHDLKSLFSDLQKKSADTFKITRKLGIDRVYKQRDAAEYIEKILRLTNKNASEIFHGVMSHKTKCCKCGTKSDRDEAFLHLPLALVDSCRDVYSVVDGIREFFRDSVFSGEDQMYCETCDDKADATTQYVVKQHPDVLILQLKRFEFSYHHMSYVKNSRTVDVPFTIQMPERQTYKLYAVVDHSGDLRGGHYTATIKDEGEDRWYNFNDSRVTPFDFQPFQVDHTVRSQTSQLLFFRKTEEAVNQDNVSNKQCEDAEKTKQRQQWEADSETGDITAVAPSVGENGVRGNEDLDRDVSRGDEERKYDYHQDARVNIQKTEEGTQVRDDEEDMRGNAEADDQTQNARLAGVEIKQTESIKKEKRLDANFKPEVSNSEYRVPTESRVMDNDKMSGDRESEKPPMDNFDKDAEQETVRGDRENQERGSGQRSVHNKGRDNQLDVESVQPSDKETGPAETNKCKRSKSGNSVVTESAVSESKKQKKKKQRRKENEKKHKTPGCSWYVPKCLRSHESAEQSGEED